MGQRTFACQPLKPPGGAWVMCMAMLKTLPTGNVQLVSMSASTTFVAVGVGASGVGIAERPLLQSIAIAPSVCPSAGGIKRQMAKPTAKNTNTKMRYRHPMLPPPQLSRAPRFQQP
ncbi:MAG: hypothetical protein WEE64_14020 [Dehalococcoidia bacterium]